MKKTRTGDARTGKEHISGKSRDIHSFIVMDIMERAGELERRGENIVHMEIGEPDFDTPEPIKKAGIAAIEKGYTKYTHSLGLLELRKQIVLHYKDEYGVALDPEQVMVTSGASNALFLVFAALLDKGDRVIMPDPGYSCYPNLVSFLGGAPAPIRLNEENGFAMTPDLVERELTDKTRAILINSPANPTGMVMDTSAMEGIAELGAAVVADEIYHGLVYEGRARSILEFTDNAFVINGFSKRYAMTGWRLGYVIAPRAYIRPLQKMQQNFNISANSFVQWGGVAALAEGAPYVREMREVFNKRRLFIVDGLRALGLEIQHPPLGAYYVFVNTSKYGADSLALALDILETAHVALTPGVDFGPGGEGYIRLSYASSMENIDEGLKRLKKYFKA